MKADAMKFLAAYCVSCLLASGASAATLDLHGLKPQELALWAAPVEGGGELASLRADVPVNPASTMKLITSWAALNRLKPGYRWTTRLVSDAPVENGVLKGDLVWVGAGDPRFSNANLQELLHGLRLRGIQRIAGRLLLDKSAFSGIGRAEDFDGDEGRSFTVEPDTHLTGLKVAWLHFFNDDNGARAVLDPPLAGIQLQVRLSRSAAAVASCPDVRQWVQLRQQGKRIEVSGQLPAACDGSQAYVNVLEHNDFAAQSFAAQWAELGGSGPQGMALGSAPIGARMLAQFQSEPLSVALADINKYSNNTMARTVYLTLGREDGSSGDTPADAEHAVRRLLAEQHIADNVLVLENGCGLSRRERLSARLLGQVLLNAARGPYAGELLASLPVAGEDGTLKHRFASIGPRLRLKTGTLKDVKALAGYWQAADGRRLAIVAIVNSPRALAMGPALDGIVADLIQRFDRSAPDSSVLPAPDAIMQP